MQVSFTNWCFIINICIIPYAFPALLITYRNIVQNLFSMLIETYLDQKVPWNFLQSSMELFEQHLNDTCGFQGINSMELEQHILNFHGIPWNFVQIQTSMEFHGTFSILIPWNFKFPPKNSMEFHGIFLKFHGIHGVPWNLINFILKKIIFLNIFFLVFDWWLDVIWLKSHRNATYCINFNIVIRILNTPMSAKMAQGQRKRRAVIYIISHYIISDIISYIISYLISNHKLSCRMLTCSVIGNMQHIIGNKNRKKTKLNTPTVSFCEINMAILYVVIWSTI